MAYKNITFAFLIFLAIVHLTNGFIFKDWGNQGQRPTASRGRTGVQWGRPHNQRSPIFVPCDGTPAITQACDTFCKSIKAAQGACIPVELTCGCTGSATTPSLPPEPVEAQTEPVRGIKILPPPDLSIPTPNITSGTPEPHLLPNPVERNETTSRKRETKSEQVVQASGSKEPASSCTRASCSIKCVAQGYQSCSAECVGLSCFCRCPSLEKPNPAPEPLQEFQQKPGDPDLSNAFRPPTNFH